MSEPVERRLSALLSADVAGYSQLIASDEVGTVRTLTAYREEMAVLANQHKGRVVDSPGDNVLMEFPSATDAVEAAVEMQRVIGERNRSLEADRRLEFRMGVHLGEVLVEGDRIYGDGVNIAARIEGLADPGGVSVSEIIRSQVVNKVDADFIDQGEHELKNIDAPVRVWALGIEKAGKASMASDRPDTDTNAAWIAVLPFENLGGNEEDDYFADGLTEDVITALSAFRTLRVIARTASFNYKETTASIPKIASQLGVRFVLEGSVRRAGSRLRVTAQLIEAADLHHIWADRYDAEIEDIFDIQDRITEGIVVAIDPAIRTAESVRLGRLRPENVDAWGHVQRGWTEFYVYKPESNREARSHFTEAVRLDPNYAQAHSGLALTHAFDAFLLWVDDPNRSLELAHESAKMGSQLDPTDAMGWAALGFVSWRLGRLERAAQLTDKAIELNPSLAISYAVAAAAHTYGGDPEKGVAMSDRLLALAPNDPSATWFWGGRAIANFLASNPEAAIDDARAAIRTRFGYLFGRALVAASLVDLGRLDEAKAEMEAILDIAPDFDSHRFDGYTFRFEKDRQHLIENLKTAGMES